MRFRWLQNVALLMVATLIALGMGEVLVRAVAPQQLILLRPDIWQPVDSLGWAHRPNLHTRVNTGDRTVTMQTDRDGFRIATGGRPPGDYRILLLGDSFVAAMQVEYEQSLPGLIERCFATRTGKSASVWNAAVSGWDPPHYLMQARRSLATAPFDLVLVAVYLGNDVVDRRYVIPPREAYPRHTFHLPRHFTYGEFVDGLLAPINDGLETRSHLFIFFKTRLEALLMRAGLTAVEVPTDLRREEATSPRWQVTGDILADIDSFASAYGVPAAFALIPANEQVDPAVFQLRTKAFGIDPTSLDLDQPDRLMVAELQRRGLSFVSLLAPLRAGQARGLPMYGRVDPHPSEEGHRIMWDAVAPLLARRLGLKYDVGTAAGAPCTPP